MRISGIGPVLLGVSVGGLALLGIACGNFAPELEPFPGSLPWQEMWAYGLGAILLTASAALFFGRTALPGAFTIGILELAWTAARLHPVLVQPLSIGSWYGMSESLGAFAGALTLCARLRRPAGAGAQPSVAGDRATRGPRGLFGAACLVYGAAHFAYASYTAAMVPAWLPGRMAFVYLTGAAHTAAGFALIVGVLPRLAATLEAIMMCLFGVVVWFPSFFAHPRPSWGSSAQVQWSEILVTFLLASSAWIVAESLQTTRGDPA